MEEMVICKTGYGEGISDEGVMGRVDALLIRMQYLVNNISALCNKIVGVRDEKIVAKTTECIEQDWGLNSEIVGP